MPLEKFKAKTTPDIYKKGTKIYRRSQTSSRASPVKKVNWNERIKKFRKNPLSNGDAKQF